MRHVKSHLRQKGVSEDEAKMSLWYYCDKCGKKFHAEYYLEKHIREVHEGAFTPSTWDGDHVTVLLSYCMNFPFAALSEHFDMEHSNHRIYVTTVDYNVDGYAKYWLTSLVSISIFDRRGVT